jgi:integrase/recombinase XerD
MDVVWERYPLLAAHQHARRWLQFTANLGRAANTIDAYGRAVEDHLRVCALLGADPLTLRPDVVAAWIGDLHQRPTPRSAQAGHPGSGGGLANATIQQRIVAVRLFYDYLVEDGLRERNPVRRGQSGRRGRRPERVWSRGCSGRPGSPTRQPGRACWRSLGPSRCATG